jgi:hypothetical protein
MRAWVGGVIAGWLGLTSVLAVAQNAEQQEGAASEPRVSEPERLSESGKKLGPIFPLEQVGADIRLTEAVWIHKDLVLPRGSVVKNIFHMPLPDDADVKDIKKGRDWGQNFARGGANVNSYGLTPRQEAFRRRAMDTTLPSHLHARAVLNVQSRGDLYIVVQPPGSAIGIESVDLPEGILFTDSGEGPMVRWVRAGSSAVEAGFREGDRVIGFNGNEIKSLAGLQSAYVALRRAGSGGPRHVAVEVRHEGESAPTFLRLRAPAVISGGFLDAL